MPTCQGQAVTLVATGPPPLVWSDGYVGASHTVRASGSYWVQGTGIGACRTLPSDTLLIALHPLPPVEAGPGLELCEGDAARLNPSEDPAYAYAWQPAGPTFAAAFTGTDTQQPQRTPYTLTATDPATGCQNRDTATVTVHSRYELRPDGLAYCDPVPLLIPNVVTPGSGGENRTFLIKALPGYEATRLEVYNRYGRLVYSASPYGNDWSAEGLPAGVYYYRLQVPLPGWDKKGWVEVVR